MRLLLGLVTVVAISSLVSPSTPSTGRAARVQRGSYMLRQLDRLTKDNWARVAARDTGLPPHVNGHDEFAATWTREILANLHGLPATVIRRPFAAPGFRGLPPQRPAVNIVVAVPGSRRPDKAVVVGAHYDGEPLSKGSAFDDASGCVLMLGLSRVLGDLWRTHGLPSLTVEFVLFDAEEEDLDGSLAFAYDYLHGAFMPRPVLMMNEEQSGVGYPARPFGLVSQGPMPSFALFTGHIPKYLALTLGPIKPPKGPTLALLARQLRDARSTAFGHLHVAYPQLQYRGGSARAFTRGDERYLHVGPVPYCCSDNAAFDAIGIPTVTFSGDYVYYDRDAPSWSFPYDQPQDTLRALACDTGGSPQPGSALRAALDLPLQMSLAMLSRYAPPAKGSGITIVSTLPRIGRPVRFQLVGAQDASWSLGDGAHATGVRVTHTYTRQGVYRVAVRSGRVARSWRLTVPASQADFRDPIPAGRPPGIKHWRPEELQDRPGCH